MGNWIRTTIELRGLPAGAIVEKQQHSRAPGGGSWTEAAINTDALRDAGLTAIADLIDDIGFDDADCSHHDIATGRITLYDDLDGGTGRIDETDLPEILRDTGIPFRFHDDGDGAECHPNEIAWDSGWPGIRRRDAIRDGDIAIGQAEATHLLKTCDNYEEFGRRIAAHLDLPALATSEVEEARA